MRIHDVTAPISEGLFESLPRQARIAIATLGRRLSDSKFHHRTALQLLDDMAAQNKKLREADRHNVDLLTQENAKLKEELRETHQTASDLFDECARLRGADHKLDGALSAGNVITLRGEPR